MSFFITARLAWQDTREAFTEVLLEQLAALLGKRQSTIEHWAKTGRVPAQWQPPLMSLGRQRGVILEAKDFVELKPNPIQPAEGRLGILLVGLGMGQQLALVLDDLLAPGNRGGGEYAIAVDR